VAEADETHQAELAAGDPDSPMMNPEEFGKLTQEMLSYAFGPANALEMAGSGVGSLFNLGDETFQAATRTVNEILSEGQGVPTQTPVLPAEEALVTPSVPNIDNTLP
jgi:hypothetical protein